MVASSKARTARRPAPKQAAKRARNAADKPARIARAHGVCAYLIVADARAAINFYQRAFGAKLDFHLEDPSDGRIGHAELTFGSARLFLADEYADFGAIGPERIGGSPVKLHLDVADADAFVAQAARAGATVLQPVKLEFFGYRKGLVADPFGYSWFIATQVEPLTARQMQRRWNELSG